MAFKIERKVFDLDLLVPLINGTEIEVKCIKNMNAEEYAKYTKFCRDKFPGIKTIKEAELGNKEQEDKTVFLRVVDQIDYLYEKGSQWWLDNVSPQTIISIQDYHNDFHRSLGKKNK